jgi:hypothetical protein
MNGLESSLDWNGIGWFWFWNWFSLDYWFESVGQFFCPLWGNNSCPLWDNNHCPLWDNNRCPLWNTPPSVVIFLLNWLVWWLGFGLSSGDIFSLW